IALLRRGEPPLFALARLSETIVPRRRFPQERQRHDDDARDREDGADEERSRHASANAPAYRCATRRSSPPSGHTAISAPARNTNPANQMRLTSGFCSGLRSIVPSGFTWSAMRNRSLPSTRL